MRDLSSSEIVKSFHKYRMENSKPLIMRGLSFSGIVNTLQKYRIEIWVSGAGMLGGTSGLSQRQREFQVSSTAEDGLRKIFTDYGSTGRAKLRTVVGVHDAMLFRNAAQVVDGIEDLPQSSRVAEKGERFNTECTEKKPRTQRKRERSFAPPRMTALKLRRDSRHAGTRQRRA